MKFLGGMQLFCNESLMSVNMLLQLVTTVTNSNTKICIINHTLLSIIRAVISTLTCTSMASNSTSDSECYLAIQVHVRVLLLPNCMRIQVCD